jgi:spore coat protein U-like protein
VGFLACVVLLLCATCAHAAADCTVTTSGLAFGVYDPTVSVPNESVGSVTVTCSYAAPGGSTTVPFTLALSTGTSGNFTQRQLASGTKRLGYNLYRDAARTQVLGTGTGGSFTLAGSLTVGPGAGNGTRAQTFSIYGAIPALQDAQTGTYGDALMATLTF